MRSHATSNAVPIRSHIRAIYDGRDKFARYLAVADQHFAGREIVDEQEYEMYDTWEDPYEIRNLANDPGYQRLKKELLGWLYERENTLFVPVALPPAGPGAPITKLPEVPSTGATNASPPNPWVGSQPGAYATVPAEQPNPASFLYEGGLPGGIGGPTSAQHALDQARFFCELAPGA